MSSANISFGENFDNWELVEHDWCFKQGAPGNAEWRKGLPRRRLSNDCIWDRLEEQCSNSNLHGDILISEQEKEKMPNVQASFRESEHKNDAWRIFRIFSVLSSWNMQISCIENLVVTCLAVLRWCSSVRTAGENFVGAAVQARARRKALSGVQSSRKRFWEPKAIMHSTNDTSTVRWTMAPQRLFPQQPSVKTSTALVV